MHAGPGEPATRPWAAVITQPRVTAKSGLHDRSFTPHNHPTAMNLPTATGAGVSARRDFQALQIRRMAAADMFARGERQVDVVDKLGVSAQTASRWHPIFLAEGKKGLAGAASRAGRLPKLADERRAQVEQALLKDPPARPRRRNPHRQPNQRLGLPQSTDIDDYSSADAESSIALPPRRLWLSALVAIIAMAILVLVGVSHPSHRPAPTPAPKRRTAENCPLVATHAKMPDALKTPGDASRLDASLIKLGDPSLLDPSLFTPGDRCRSGYVPKKLQWLTSFSKAMHDANITTPDQRAAFLAQIAEETGGLRMVTERPWGLPRSQWNDEQAVRNYFNNKYANINGNGDVSSGDGYNYRGRGILQITGKSNYAAVSEKLYGDDRLVKNPDLVSQPDAACAAAAAYWNENDLNRFIPPGQPVTPQEFQDLGSTINTGHPGHVPNNAATREKYWEVAKEALGVT
jgi:putative chitinase